MNISEKLLNLRKAHNLTQEQLAEQLNVSRQSISKWESGQCIPDADKLKLLSDIFNVSIDFLLKPSELDALTLKAESLENQQRNLENTIRKKEKTKNIILGCASIYIIAFAIIMLINQISWENEFLWNIFSGITLPIIILFLATAIAIIFYIKNNKK
ncbi:helix-turn-helix domain-containing protein [Roseburia intestinalis]|jgi:transcriptional regulator with XRE-family HTH domain|uniref:helix-turn-helix domain-containing protein n=1 Tax=Roseburia intestinalis TaxID=166486 RepID=UPI0022E17FD8|nr:helix-turn-helix domain-containing protein [Roseburia intestinalis]